MSFAQRLSDVMESQGISTYRMSKDTGIPEATIGRWKNGKAVPSGENLAEAVKYLNVSADYLLLGSDQKNKPLVNNDKELTEYLELLKTRPEMKMLFDITKGATKADVEKAVEIIEAYLKK